MFDQLSAEIPASLIKGFTRTTTTKQNVDPAVHFVYSRVKNSVLGTSKYTQTLHHGHGIILRKSANQVSKRERERV
jgi:hypothetical protein